jgi:4'-phosphopantetheinyl transferase
VEPKCATHIMVREGIVHRFFEELKRRDVHVWSVRTEASHALAERFEPILARDERERAMRFRFTHLRDSFIVVRGTLRILLGRYLDVSAAGIKFEYSSKGKPSVIAPGRIEFSVSHSGTLATFAFTAGCVVGVDVEQIRPLPELLSIVDSNLCSEEIAELMSLAADERERAFFLCWTRKEAYVKAIGDGLSATLHDFRVTVLPGERPRIIRIAHDANASRVWTLNDLQLGLDYAATLAYRDVERPVAVLPLINPAELLGIS